MPGILVETLASEIGERLSRISSALVAGEPSAWISEAKAIREACEPLRVGKLCARCEELEKLDSPTETRVAALIFESMTKEFSRVQSELS